MKDAKGHGSNAHGAGVAQVGQGFRTASPQEFLEARNRSGRPEMFTPHTPEDLARHQLFMNHEGTVGAAVSPEGDIQSVFNNSGVKGAGGAAIEEAKARGGRTLDAFGDKLASVYKQHGFVETGRAKFDPKQAPPGWMMKADRPDIVFMRRA